MAILKIVFYWALFLGATLGIPPSVVTAEPALGPAVGQKMPIAKAAPKLADRSRSASARRQARMGAVSSWGYQLQRLDIEFAVASPYDLLIVDATAGIDGRRHLEPAEVERLKRKPDGSRRLVLSYLSIGEAEDYRADYFGIEYLSEDAPDWLGPENPNWKGNRVVYFCKEGWQRTIIGDDAGRNVYNGIEPSPLLRLVELGFDGVYLDRADVYSEVSGPCPDGAAGMVKFIVRLAAQARRASPEFLVILQNAEELLEVPSLIGTIDGVAKEDLFYGAQAEQQPNSRDSIVSALRHLRRAKAAKRPVLVVDYLERAEDKADFVKRVRAEGFVPYVGPRDLGQLWIAGREF